MKTCSKCFQEKDINQFDKNKNKKDGRQTYCKNCRANHQKEWYKTNKKLHRSRSDKSKFVRQAEAREYVVNYLRQHSCINCKENDILVLDFDHLNDKKFSISTMVALGTTLLRIKKEVEKCQVLCANCHRRKTMKELGWYKSFLQ